MSEYIGRQESVGFGIEATAGTAVAPQIWARHLSNGFKKQTSKINNESAIGVVEKTNASAIEHQWAEGTVEMKLSDITIGYLLYGLLGTVSSADNSDSDASVKDHTITVKQTSVPNWLFPVGGVVLVGASVAG